ncbi:leucine-rich repeat protein [Lysinibacillus sp. OTC-L20]|uniref:leucine-rich repeat protein n=1 Tax=Lysinibacillus sp. OTC-L20 TaxID=3342791 RepID=UPI0035B7BE48
MKKLASLFLIVLLLNLQWGNIPVYGAANSESDFLTNPNGTGVTIKSYKGTTKDVTIPPTIDGQAVTSIGDSAFRYNQLTNVTIPSSVTSIGDSAFAYNQLTNVTIPSSVTNIGEFAFASNQLTNVTIPSSVTSIGASAFASNKLTNVTIPSSVTNIGEFAFYNNQLTNVTIPSSVTSIGDSAFYYNQLTNVTIPSSVTNIGASAFASNKLTNVTIPSSVTNIGEFAFQSNKLTNVTIPSSVTSIGASAFASNQLTNVTIPSSVTSIGDSAFASNQLTNVTIPSSVTSIGASAFRYNKLPNVTIPSSVTSIGDSVFYSNQLTDVTIPSSVTSIGEYAFYNNKLTNVTIPSSVTSIGAFAFRSNQLPNVTIHSSVTSIGEFAFYNNQLTNVTIPSSVTSIGDSAFAYNQLPNVTIPSSVTSIGDYVFYSNQLTDVTIHSSVTSIGGFAFASNQLPNVTIPSSVTSIGTFAFYNNQLNQVEFKGQISRLSQTAFNHQAKPGATFHGWFEDQSYTTSWTYTVTAPMIIYAKWPTYSTGIVLSPKTGQLTVGGTQNFQLIENLSDGTTQDQTGNAQFTVDDSAIATMQDNVLTAIAPGTVTVRATYGSTSDTATITVNSAPVTTTGISLSPKTGQLTVGGTQNFQLIENLSDGTTQDQTGNAQFTVDNSAIATMQDNVLTAIAPGTVTVRATYGSTSDTATITVNSAPVTTTGISLSPKTGQLTVGGTQNFQLIENLSDGTTQDQTGNAQFTVDNSAIATMQDNVLTAIAPGTVAVRATYGSTSDTATITVNSAPVTTTGISLSPKTGQLTVGGTQNFQLIENLSDGTTQDQTAKTGFTVSDPTVATIQGSTLTAIAPGTVTVTATYGSSFDTATITVKAPTTVPETTPVPQPDDSVEPMPSGVIPIIRTVEQGIVRYHANVLLEPVQVQVQQMSNQEERTIRLVYPAETATVEAILHLPRTAGLYLNKQQTNLFMQTALAHLMMPSTAFNGITEDIFFRIMPVKAQQQEMIQANVRQNEHIQQAMPNRATLSLLGTPVTIETNLQNRPITITLPISAALTAEQMASLVVYIEHSDATTEVKRGRIVEFEPGVKGFQFEVDHFSTFSLVYASEVQEEEKEEVETNRLVPYIQGYPDGTFKPNASVTRAQMATMLARFLTNGKIPTAEVTFEDTEKNTSKYAIEFVKQAGLFNGTTQTKFDPNGTITRAQMAGVIARWVDTVCAQDDTKTYCQTAKPGKVFSDVAASHWAASSIERVSALGIMTGNSATTFNPNGALTRAQAVKVLNQLFERPTVENITESTFRDVPASHWAIGVIEAAATEMTMKK